MLYRVSGRLTDGTPFSARIESANAVTALGTGRKALNDAEKDDDMIAEMRVRAAKNGRSVTFGKVLTPDEIKAKKAARAAKKAAGTTSKKK